MSRDVGRTVLLAAVWPVLAVGIDLILRATLPGLDERADGIIITAIFALLIATGVTVLGWWRDAGYTPVPTWRDLGWLAVPALLCVVPLVTGIKPLDGTTYVLLIAGYLLTGFVEETMFRGVFVKVLTGRSAWTMAGVSSVLFGLVHLGNIVVRGEVAIILAQAVGAAAFGFGYFALRLRTNTVLPLVLLHAASDLFLQMGRLPLIPVAVAQDVVLFGLGVWLLRGLRSPQRQAAKQL